MGSRVEGLGIRHELLVILRTLRPAKDGALLLRNSSYAEMSLHQRCVDRFLHTGSVPGYNLNPELVSIRNSD